jgi:hypothetical protein
LNLTQGLSKPRNIRERQPAGVDVQAAKLGAAVELGKHLAGIEQALGIERRSAAFALGKLGNRAKTAVGSMKTWLQLREARR